MTAIAVVDDRKGERDTVVRSLASFLPPDWLCFGSPPLERVGQYIPWIAQHEVVALVLDQRLNEQAPDSESHVTYKGDEVVREVRTKLPYFPVFVVTGYKDDDDLKAHDADVEAIVTRGELTDEPNTHAQRIVRAANRFSEERKKQISNLTELSKKVAAGNASRREVESLRAIQGELGLAFILTETLDRIGLLDELEQKLTGFEKLAEELKPFVKGAGE